MDHVPPPLPPQEAWPDPVKPPLPEAESPVFTGSGREYFRIWIVNLCLTLVTLGFYIPWARVRTRRYFYRHTLLGGSSFDYLADPKRLLVGYLIVGVLFLVYMLGDLISIWVTLGALGVFFLAFPYIRYKSLRFFARNSAYQNVRLHFHGTPGEAYRIYLGMMLFVPLTLGLLYPYVAHQGSKYLFGNLAFGSARSAFTAGCRRFYAIYLGAFGVFLVAFLILVALVTASFSWSLGSKTATVAETVAEFSNHSDEPVPAEEIVLTRTKEAGERSKDLTKGENAQLIDPEDGEDFGLLMGLAAVAFYFVPVMVFLAAGVLIRNHCWNNFRLLVAEGDPARGVWFRSRMKVFPFLGIQLSNLFLIVLTLGIFLPWAKVRIHRYRLRCLEVHGLDHLAGVMADTDTDQNAIGDSASDLFDLEFGL